MKKSIPFFYLIIISFLFFQSCGIKNVLLHPFKKQSKVEVSLSPPNFTTLVFPKAMLGNPKTVLANLVEIDPEKEAARVRHANVQKTQQQKKIKAKEQSLNVIRNNYLELHLLMKGYIESEATSRLLYHNYYKIHTERMNMGLQGLHLSLIGNNFPANFSSNDIRQYQIKLTQAFVEALGRYQWVSDLELHDSTTSIEIAIYGNDETIVNDLEKVLQALPIAYHLRYLPMGKPQIRIHMISNHFFEKQFAELIETQKEISQQIYSLKHRTIH